jgi:hypothetical protein
MSFFQEPTHYEKTILSDLQGAWSCLRTAVEESGGFPGIDRMLFHIDEAMSWETVRHGIHRMKPLLILIRNIAVQGKADDETLQFIEDIQEILDEMMPPK